MRAILLALVDGNGTRALIASSNARDDPRVACRDICSAMDQDAMERCRAKQRACGGTIVNCGRHIVRVKVDSPAKVRAYGFAPL